MAEKAILLSHIKRLFLDGAIIEIRLWLVPEAVVGSAHPYKYSLYYGSKGERLVCYDNERGKGDHRHFKGQEGAYAFLDPETLAADFFDDVARLRGGSL